MRLVITGTVQNCTVRKTPKGKDLHEFKVSIPEIKDENGVHLRDAETIAVQSWKALPLEDGQRFRLLCDLSTEATKTASGEERNFVRLLAYHAVKL